MITINLLPVELRPVKRTPVPYILSVALMAFVVVASAQIILAKVTVLEDLVTENERNESELRSLKDSVDKYNQLAEEKKLLAAQLDTIKLIASDRIIWSEQLYHLTRLALPNMWYSKISVEKRRGTRIVETTDTSGKVKKTKVPDDKHILTIEAYVSPDATGKMSISPFVSAADSDEEFSRQFALENFSYDDTNFGDTTVKKFVLEYLILSGGTE